MAGSLRHTAYLIVAAAVLLTVSGDLLGENVRKGSTYSIGVGALTSYEKLLMRAVNVTVPAMSTIMSFCLGAFSNMSFIVYLLCRQG